MSLVIFLFCCRFPNDCVCYVFVLYSPRQIFAIVVVFWKVSFLICCRISIMSFLLNFLTDPMPSSFSPLSFFHVNVLFSKYFFFFLEECWRCLLLIPFHKSVSILFYVVFLNVWFLLIIIIFYFTLMPSFQLTVFNCSRI